MADNPAEPSPEDAKPQTEETKTEAQPKEGDLVAKKLIDENRGYRNKNSGLRKDLETAQKELSDYQEAKLSEEGKHKEAAEFYKKKAADFEEKYKGATSSYATTVVTSQVKAAAAEMGCLDLDAVIKLAPMADLYDHIDEDYTIKPQAVKDLLDMMKQKRSYLFQKSAPKIEDAPLHPKPETQTGKPAASTWDMAKTLAEISRK